MVCNTWTRLWVIGIANHQLCMCCNLPPTTGQRDTISYLRRNRYPSANVAIPLRYDIVVWDIWLHAWAYNLAYWGCIQRATGPHVLGALRRHFLLLLLEEYPELNLCAHGDSLVSSRQRVNNGCPVSSRRQVHGSIFSSNNCQRRLSNSLLAVLLRGIVLNTRETGPSKIKILKNWFSGCFRV